jgi:hypothetical protein
MSALLDLMNQLAATYLERKPLPPGPFTPKRVTIQPDGFELSGELSHPQVSGPVALRIAVEPTGPERFRLRVTPVTLPTKLAPPADAYRDVLERLVADVSLDFSGPAPGAGGTPPQ